MSNSTKSLHSVYAHQAVREFGGCLRRALQEKTDYASLIELENAESAEDFFKALKDFLRRYDGYVRKHNWWRPSDTSLTELAELVNEYNTQVVRTALISHALVWGKSDSDKKEESDEQ